MKIKNFFHSMLLLFFLGTPVVYPMFSDENIDTSDEELEEQEGMDMIELFTSFSPKTMMQNAIAEGDLKKVKQLIASYHHNPHQLVSLNSQTPLHVAIIENKQDIFNYLVGETVFGTYEWINKPTLDINDYNNDTPLLTCVKKLILRKDDCSSIHTLLLHGANIHAQDHPHAGTALWCLAYDYNKNGEAMVSSMAQVLVFSGADMILTCGHKHRNIHGRGCSPYERALKRGHLTLAEFLKQQQDLQLTLEQRFEQAPDKSIQQNVFARAIFYESFDILWAIMGLVKQEDKKEQSKNFSTMQAIENSVVKRLITSQCLDRLLLVLHQGFHCTEKDIKNIKNIIEKDSKKYKGKEKFVAVLEPYAYVSINRQVHHLRSLIKNENFSDVVCICSDDLTKELCENKSVSKKRIKSGQDLVTVTKKTKQ